MSMIPIELFLKRYKKTNPNDTTAIAVFAYKRSFRG